MTVTWPAKSGSDLRCQAMDEPITPPPMMTTSDFRGALLRRHLGAAEMGIDRHRQPHPLAQRLALVGLAEQAAALQFGNHQVDEVVQAARHNRRVDVEAVAGLLGVPGLDLVADL